MNSRENKRTRFDALPRLLPSTCRLATCRLCQLDGNRGLINITWQARQHLLNVQYLQRLGIQQYICFVLTLLVPGQGRHATAVRIWRSASLADPLQYAQYTHSNSTCDIPSCLHLWQLLSCLLASWKDPTQPLQLCHEACAPLMLSIRDPLQARFEAVRAQADSCSTQQQ